MSSSGVGGGGRGIRRGENRFYHPPPVRKLKEERERERRLEEDRRKRNEEEEELQQRRAAAVTVTKKKKKKKKENVSPAAAVSSAVASVAGSSEECGSSDCSVSSRFRGGGSNAASNLDRFLEYTTPVVPAQYFPRTSVKNWRNRELEYHPYFVLSDLWKSFEEWSVYGAGVPLILNGRDFVVQYYVPYLSGIQLYINPSRPGTRLRRPAEDSDADSSRETSSDGSIADINILSFNRLSLEDNKPFVGSSSDESEIGDSPGQLIFEYLEHDSPFGREPLADKISNLALRFPQLRTYQSCDLSPSSWVSVSWYPIYRIPMGPTLQNLDACFLTFHYLSTPFQGASSGRSNSHNHLGSPPSKLPLPTFGLALYKSNVSVWYPNGVHEYQRANSLLQAADNWLKGLHVNHPDYKFFVSHSSQWR